MSDDDASARLLAMEEIRHLKARYCRLLDEKNWSELLEVFADEAYVEITGAPGAPAGEVQRFGSSGAFVEALRSVMQPLRTVHQVYAPEITIHDPDSGSGIWAFADRVAFPDGGP